MEPRLRRCRRPGRRGRHSASPFVPSRPAASAVRGSLRIRCYGLWAPRGMGALATKALTTAVDNGGNPYLVEPEDYWRAKAASESGLSAERIVGSGTGRPGAVSINGPAGGGPASRAIGVASPSAGGAAARTIRVRASPEPGGGEGTRATIPPSGGGTNKGKSSA